jgi:cytochrome c oxidase subunit 4
MAHASEHTAGAAHQEQHGLTVQQYLIIGGVLTVVTVIELAVSYSPLPNWLMIATLFVLSAFKFAMVAAYFMHLRFESGLMTRVFAGSFMLAAAILLALITMFWGDLADGIRANRVEPGAAATAAPH